MKKLLVILICVIFQISLSRGQYYDTGLSVRTMEGRIQSLNDFINQDEGHITLFVFWKTCCPANLEMIDGLFEMTDEFGESDRLTVVLVSVDDIRTTERVKPVVRMKGWEADVILDVNMELARTMSVHIPPQWVAVDNTGKPVYRRKIMEGETDTEYYFNELADKF